jgi:hypothetical protein
VSMVELTLPPSLPPSSPARDGENGEELLSVIVNDFRFALFAP